MSEFDADAIMSELKKFQRDAVEHVMDRFYRDEGGSGRFLIADETGLGKSVIARGIIARTIEALQHDDRVDRIDVVYICSNADLASQNLRRLNVTGNRHIGITSRLTLLARESANLAKAERVGGKRGKRVNLVSFTPGTSFDAKGNRAGAKEERALIHLMLQKIAPGDGEVDERASRILLQASVQSEANFQRVIDDLRASTGGRLDPGIRKAFATAIRDSGLLREFRKLRIMCRGLDGVPDSIPMWRHHDLIAKLRAALAKAGVETLEPDLIILDEFQRFRHLLDEGSGEAAELAHALFNFSDAKVLLLSATPYKPFTKAESDGDESHYEDFMTTLGFLANDAATLTEIRKGFRDYRMALLDAEGSADATAERLGSLLTPFVTRSERPQLEEGADLLPRWIDSAVPSVDDVLGFAGLEHLGRALDAPIGLEYWKSIPYFGNFMEGYKSGRRARELLMNDPAIDDVFRAIPSLDAGALEAYEELDFGNSHLRALAAETLDAGWWQLLWMPPSMPYLEPGPVYRGIGSITKRVLFSAWASVPTAIASLLSYEAERRMVAGSDLLKANTADARRAISDRLTYVTRDSGPAGMSTLALFWPHPALAVLGDPLAVARAHGRLVTDSEVIDSARSSLDSSNLPPADFAWHSYFQTPGGVPSGMSLAELSAALEARASSSEGIDDADVDEVGRKGLPAHVELVLQTAQEPRSSHERVADLAANGPGNIAWRALARVRTDSDNSTDLGHWRAAARLANGVRSLFNRTETKLLLDRLYGASRTYWHAVLDYCADGNLQAVLDEYVFQLRSESPGSPVDDALLESIASRAAEALTLRPSRYTAQDVKNGLTPIPLTARFALRYGGRTDASEGARQPEIRNAFNSPFWPFVLASTSVGQEGIDFHWWSHCVVHWNLPSNPVDFEQREGRVNRFAGHAVRKNVADAHWRDVLSSDNPSPWALAFEAAEGAQPDLGEFAPWWIYRGPARIERSLVAFPLSRDRAKYERLRADLALYRLTLGQPRQEDMVEILRRQADGEKLPMLDLRPPGGTRHLE
ncbi:helicase-related protein [Agromyces sp. MMS24-K17]|uniref:helicase-related protein n=1 Tax=Agromyces sp. MMS24-K17 TaxID=3372850 RepID=UPI0037551A05